MKENWINFNNAVALIPNPGTPTKTKCLLKAQPCRRTLGLSVSVYEWEQPDVCFQMEGGTRRSVEVAGKPFQGTGRRSLGCVQLPERIPFKLCFSKPDPGPFCY